MKAPTSAFIGTLRTAHATEDTETFVYRPERRFGRGAVELAAAGAVFAGAVAVVRNSPGWYGWVFGALPLLACAVLAARGLAWIWPRPMFTLTVDRRARTLLVAMPTERGHGMAKTRYADVVSVELAERDGAFALSLPLADGRRIGLGFLRRPEDAEALAARFAALIGVGLRRA